MIFPKIEITDHRKRPTWNATNTAFKVTMWRGASNPAAVMAQEVAESRMKLPWTLASILFPPLVIYWRSASWRRRLEFRGKMVEVIVARQWYAADRFDAEARSLYQNDAYPQFGGWTLGLIEVGMHDAEPWAQDWIAKHKRRIDGWFSEFGG